VSAEIGPLIITTTTGFVILFLFYKNNFLKGFSQKYNTKNVPPPKEDHYDKLEQIQLTGVASKISNRYRILLISYVVVLAFVLSNKAFLALSSWYFIVWIGWMLAIIFRTAGISRMLSSAVKSHSTIQSRNKIYHAEISFRFSPYLLGLSIAFLTTFFITPQVTVDSFQYNWGFDVSVFTSILAIFCSAIFFYFLPFRFAAYVISSETIKLFLFAGLLVATGVIASFTKPPLDPIEFTFLYKPLVTVPMFFIVVFQMGNVFGFAMIGGLGKVLLDAVYVKSKK